MNFNLRILSLFIEKWWIFPVSFAIVPCVKDCNEEGLWAETIVISYSVFDRR